MQCVDNTRDWLDILSSLSIPVLAMVGAVIAFQQWKVNSWRLKHEHFDRRYDQYIAVKDYLGSIVASGKVKKDAEMKFLEGIRGIRFTFNAEIDKYVYSYIWRLASEHETLDSELEGTERGEERTNIVERRRICREKIETAYNTLDEKFSEYLQLKD